MDRALLESLPTPLVLMPPDVAYSHHGPSPQKMWVHKGAQIDSNETHYEAHLEGPRHNSSDGVMRSNPSDVTREAEGPNSPLNLKESFSSL